MTMQSRVTCGASGLLMLALVLVATLVGLGVLVVLNARRRSATVASPPADAALGVPLEARRDAREAVLRKLAAKELTREQAEVELAALDNPVPEVLPTPQAQRGVGGLGCGCLVASLLGLMILIVCGACYAYFSVRHARAVREQIHRKVVAAGHWDMASQRSRGTVQVRCPDPSDSVEQPDVTRVLIPEAIQDGGIER